MTIWNYTEQDDRRAWLLFLSLMRFGIMPRKVWESGFGYNINGMGSYVVRAGLGYKHVDK